MTTKGKSKRGLAVMDPERVREISRLGRRAVQAKGTAHRFTSEELRTAGKIGGTAVSRDRAHVAAIGRKGSKAAKGWKQRARGAPGHASGDSPVGRGYGRPLIAV